MQRILIVFLLIFITLFSCKDDKVIKPESILSQQKMIHVLIDMHIADAHINLGSTPQDSARLLLTGEYAAIFKKHGIDQKSFNESHKWYVNHTEELDAIYEKVVSRLEAKKDSLQ